VVQKAALGPLLHPDRLNNPRCRLYGSIIVQPGWFGVW
jgi:hypothetical protein